MHNVGIVYTSLIYAHSYIATKKKTPPVLNVGVSDKSRNPTAEYAQ